MQSHISLAPHWEGLLNTGIRQKQPPLRQEVKCCIEVQVSVTHWHLQYHIATLCTEHWPKHHPQQTSHNIHVITSHLGPGSPGSLGSRVTFGIILWENNRLGIPLVVLKSTEKEVYHLRVKYRHIVTLFRVLLHIIQPNCWFWKWGLIKCLGIWRWSWFRKPKRAACKRDIRDSLIINSLD